MQNWEQRCVRIAKNESLSNGLIVLIDQLALMGRSQKSNLFDIHCDSVSVAAIVI